MKMAVHRYYRLRDIANTLDRNKVPRPIYFEGNTWTEILGVSAINTAPLITPEVLRSHSGRVRQLPRDLQRLMMEAARYLESFMQ